MFGEEKLSKSSQRERRGKGEEDGSCGDEVK